MATRPNSGQLMRRWRRNWGCEMQISRRSWHFRVYEWFNSGCPVPDSVNLCPYVRTVLIWAPLSLAGKVLWRALLANRYQRAVTYGIGSMVAILLVALRSPHPPEATLLLTSFALTAWALIWVGDYLERRPKLAGTPNPPSAFRTLLRAYLTAIHDRVCPQIDIGD